MIVIVRVTKAWQLRINVRREDRQALGCAWRRAEARAAAWRVGGAEVAQRRQAARLPRVGARVPALHSREPSALTRSLLEKVFITVFVALLPQEAPTGFAPA